jgi:hypothetical protein
MASPNFDISSVLDGEGRKPTLSRAPKLHVHDIPVATQKTATEQSADRYPLDLPSRFQFYSFSTLSCGKVGANHQAKFYRAHSESKTRHIVDAISSVLDAGVSAWDLSYQDFVWVLYWIRLNQYVRTPLLHNGVCENPEHLRRVRLKQLDASTLSTVTTITKTTLKEDLLDVEALTKYGETENFSFLENTSYRLHVPTVRDLVFIEEECLERPDYPEIEFLADFAACLIDDSYDYSKGNDFLERIEFVSSLSPDDINVLSGYKDLVIEHGVREYMNFVCGCKECRAVTEVPISITAQSFL